MSRLGLLSGLLISLLALGCAHQRHPGVPAPAGTVAVRPDPIPLDETYPHRMAVRISPPWTEKGEWVLRAPETVGSNRGLLFIDHRRDDMLPAAWPLRPLRWTRNRDRSLEYECELDIGVVLRVCIAPEGPHVAVESVVINAGAADLENLGTQFCLVQSGIPAFADPGAQRTFICSGGKFVPLGNTRPGPAPGCNPMLIVTNTWDLEPWDSWEPGRSWFAECQADVPLIATVSREGNRLVAMAFDNAYKIMTNCDIPCIHADPKFPDCPAGATARIRGRIYFIEGSLADALRRFKQDFPGWRYPPDRYVIPQRISALGPRGAAIPAPAT